MFSKTTKVALSAAIVIGIAFPASAATKHHRFSYAHPAAAAPPAIYAVPGSGTCSPVHPPFCNNICTGSGPCAPPDSW